MNMRYRVGFTIYNGSYFTEWFDTESEAHQFIRNAFATIGMFPKHIENSDGEVI